MGQKRSWIPYVTAVLALCGILFAQGLQNYVMVWDWPMNFGGKPFAAWPAFIPITFEAMVFWAALGTAAPSPPPQPATMRTTHAAATRLRTVPPSSLPHRRLDGRRRLGPSRNRL